MNAARDISVIVPTRNRRELLQRHALTAALGQEDVELEVIVVDDGSTDGTAEAVGALGDDRVTVVRHESSRGLAAARNAGIAVAAGTWLAFLDDDDVWSPSKLRTQLDAAAETGVEWVYADTVVVDERLQVFEADDFPPPEHIPQLLLTGNHVPGGGSCVVARSAAIRELGGFDDELLFFTDWDMWLRLAQRGLPAACSEVLVARLVHPTNMLFREGPSVLASLERLLGKHREVTREDRLAISEWVAHRYHVAGRNRDAARLYLDAAVRYRSPGNALAALGAPFGPPGIRAASRLLRLAGGESHLDEEPRPAPEDPAWLDLYRGAA
jgi:glycosyltransferase involved in cell wall biosynthesis